MDQLSLGEGHAKGGIHGKELGTCERLSYLSKQLALLLQIKNTEK